jgi:hypothetical protein
MSTVLGPLEVQAQTSRHKIASKGRKNFFIVFRGCLIISVKAQVGVFLFKLFIKKREHSGCYVTDE